MFILNADRSRFNTGGYDWRTIPVDTGAPLSEDYNVIESYQANPVVADLDGDGKMEILYSSYDGRVHAFWLDKTEHGSWPYSVYKPAEGFIRFASEPLVADLDNDGYAEVIFTSWTQNGSNRSGKAAHPERLRAADLRDRPARGGRERTGTGRWRRRRWRISTRIPIWSWWSTRPIPGWWRMTCLEPPTRGCCGARAAAVIPAPLRAEWKLTPARIWTAALIAQIYRKRASLSLTAE